VTNVLDPLLKDLGISVKNKELLTQALIHRSYLNESRRKITSNERLEFLGDSILSFVVSNYLYQQFPQLKEGDLTNFRSSIVKTTTLASVAQTLKLGTYLFLSKGEEEGGGRTNPSILADTFEAVLGALYLDVGLEKTKKVIDKFLLPLLEQIIVKKLYKDAKSSLQELVQEGTKISPVYTVIKEVGPDHAKEFTVGVYVNDKLLGEGSGKSKQDAEQHAARAALEKCKPE